VVLTDGYGAYDFLDKETDVVHVGCWAHARRKFMDTIQAAGGRHGNGKADEAIRMIRLL
jgi:transposase